MLRKERTAAFRSKQTSVAAVMNGPFWPTADGQATCSGLRQLTSSNRPIPANRAYKSNVCFAVFLHTAVSAEDRSSAWKIVSPPRDHHRTWVVIEDSHSSRFTHPGAAERPDTVFRSPRNNLIPIKTPKNPAPLPS